MQLTWTGLEVRALRDALRETRPGFCEITGARFEALRKWERRGPTLMLRAVNAAIMDTTLARATDDQRARFDLRCAELRRKHNLPDPPIATPKLDGDDSDRPSAQRGPQYRMEINDMNRRELLRVLGVASASLAIPVDWDRVLAAASGTARIDASTARQYASINQGLWHSYSQAVTKADTFPAVREHLDLLIDGVRRSSDDHVRRHLAELTAEALQLSGEILFDNDDYETAAHCYSLAASYSKDAGAYDLWACALTRHAYLGIRNHQFDAAIPLLESAGELARRGNPALTTRYWVDAVHAQALAGLGDATGWKRASDSARGALDVASTVTSWLRFDGSRLDEERGSSYIQLTQPQRAEQLLAPMLDRPLSTRRRASVLIDLAAAAALHRDPIQLVSYGNAALDIAQRTHSGYLGRRLDDLRHHLEPLGHDLHVRHLDMQIASLLSPTTSTRRTSARRH
ncbi:transcriptional regulator [Nocardia sp. CWNU-33]|uniref:transcriptional regulator n=1 Tax=Nocardia sp. CWNU-33 TaxID=3392117 RepID=UPI00398E5FE0